MSKLRFSAAKRVAAAVGLGLLLCGPLAAREGTGHDRLKDVIIIQFNPSNHNPGGIGQGVLAGVGDTTTVTLTLSGFPAFTLAPIHLYSYLFEGSCERRNPGAVHPLTRNVLARPVSDSGVLGASRGPVRVSGRIPLSLEQLRSHAYAINVRLSPADGNREIACGNLPR